jgi:hypothetical protein
VAFNERDQRQKLYYFNKDGVVSRDRDHRLPFLLKISFVEAGG